MGIKSNFTTSYHPQCNGLTERLNKTLVDMLSLYTSTNQLDWDVFLPHVTFAYNTAQQETTRMSPFKLVYCRDPVLPTEAELLQDVNNEEVQLTKEKILEIRHNAEQNIIKKQYKDKSRYDSFHRDVHFNIGDRVKVRTPLRQVGKSDKLQPKFFGPYMVIDKLSPIIYIVESGTGRMKKTDSVHVSRMFPYFEPWTPNNDDNNSNAQTINNKDDQINANSGVNSLDIINNVQINKLINNANEIKNKVVKNDKVFVNKNKGKTKKDFNINSRVIVNSNLKYNLRPRRK